MRPFFFENNTRAETFPGATLPLLNPLHFDGHVVTSDPSVFKSNSGFESELAFLRRLQFPECTYGAACCPVHPFIGRMTAERTESQNAQTILDSLGVKSFRSQHIESLKPKRLPFPGYHPRTTNDEIHNEFQNQYMFAKRFEDDGGDHFQTGPTSPEFGSHGELRRYVRDSLLWYVLLQSWKGSADNSRNRWIVLFAVGVAPNNRTIIGCVSHQLCHNLCD